MKDKDKTQQNQINKCRSQMPPPFRRTYDKAVRGRSPSAGIKAYCHECCGWNRLEVTVCCCLGCPLYPYRPHQKRVKKEPDGLNPNNENPYVEGQ